MNLFPKTKEEVEKQEKDLEDFIRIELDHLMMIHGDAECIVECHHCGKRNMYKTMKPFAVERLEKWVIDKAKECERFKWILLASMADKVHDSLEDNP